LSLNRELPQLTINFEAFGSALAAGALDSCLAYLTRAHRNSESDTGPNCSLAEALFHRGRRDEAVECCRRAVPGLGSDTAMLRICAWVFSNCRCHDEAIAAYRRLIELCPEGIEFHRHASGSLAAIGRIDEAIADGEKASDLALQNPEFALHVGVLLLNARRYAEAAGYLGRAVALDPTTPTRCANSPPRATRSATATKRSRWRCGPPR
jgi:tetratricopeptide (TPR) repeat protein